MNTYRTSVFCLIFILLLSTPVYAHRVNIFAWIEGDRIFTQSKFNGGKRVKSGEVVVSDLKGNKLLAGKTDEMGEFNFKTPTKTALKIEILAGMGHRGEWIISAEEINGQDDPENQSSQPNESSQSTPTSSESKQNLQDNTQHNFTELEPIINRLLDKKLRPIQESLAELKTKGTSITDIIAGLGYIMGIVGIGAYFRSKQNNQ